MSQPSVNGQQEAYRPPPEKIIQTLARELAQCNDNRYYLIALVDELQEEIAKLKSEITELASAPDNIEHLESLDK